MFKNFKKLRFALTLAFALFAIGISAQTKVTVVDATGEPLIGASVIEKGTPAHRRQCHRKRYPKWWYNRFRR